MNILISLRIPAGLLIPSTQYIYFCMIGNVGRYLVNRMRISKLLFMLDIPKNQFHNIGARGTIELC